MILTLFIPKEVTRADLGHLSGNPNFTPPSPDRFQQIQQGQIPTAKHTAVYRWWYFQ